MVWPNAHTQSLTSDALETQLTVLLTNNVSSEIIQISLRILHHRSGWRNRLKVCVAGSREVDFRVSEPAPAIYSGQNHCTRCRPERPGLRRSSSSNELASTEHWRGVFACGPADYT